jgi:hypothetical protein
MSAWGRAFRENGLALFFLVLMLIAILGQSVAGYRVEVDELKQHGEASEGFITYVTSATFGSHLLENWQSEFMQFATFIAATVWLVQRGSAEGKAPGDEGLNDDQGPRGILQRLYGHSLLSLFIFLFLLTWLSQSVTSWQEFNEDGLLHEQAPIAWSSYIGSADFWERTLQNWQSEFLAVACMAIFSVYLRERGSPESKRLEVPHERNEPTY